VFSRLLEVLAAMSSYSPDERTPPRRSVDGQKGNVASGNDRLITPARIGEFIGFEQCARYFKHSVDDVTHSIHFDADGFKEAFQPLNILLTKAGEEFETTVCDELAGGSRQLVDCNRPDEDRFVDDHGPLLETVAAAQEGAPAPESPTILYQASVKGAIGDWAVAGDADLILVWSTCEGVTLRVIDVKSAQEQKSYHQIQAATYVDLVRGLLDEANGFDAEDITCEGGIITRGDTLTPPTPDDIPSFGVDSRIIDVRRLLAADGPLAEISETELENVEYQLNDKCSTCPYSEGCVTDAYEEGSLKLLGLSPAEQETLRERCSIETVDELADIISLPDTDEWYPTVYDEASFKKRDYRKLESTPGLGDRLPTLVYRAAALADWLSPDGGGAFDRHVPWIPTTGRCPLPEDNPPEELAISHEWKHGSMVRIYLNVQHDHLNDRLVQLSARVTATESAIEPQRLSVLATEIADTDPNADAVERTLLETFIGQLYDAIRAVSNGIDLSEYDQPGPPLHFYTYGGSERTALFDAFDRHSTRRIASFQSLLEGKAGHDSPMVSQLRPTVRTHTAVPDSSSGLLPAYDLLSPRGEETYRKSRGADAWSYTPSGDNSATGDDSVHLRSVFNHRLFGYRTAVSRDTDAGGSVCPGTPDYRDGLPTRIRYGAEIPLGYLWAAVGHIDDEWVEQVKSEYEVPELELARYRYHDAQRRETEITEDDVRALGRHLCDALEHVERALDSRDGALKKQPRDFDSLGIDRFAAPSLATACQRYLWIEHTAARREQYDVYRKLPPQRMLNGKTVPVHIADVEETGRQEIRVKGQMRFDEPFAGNADDIRRACRLKGSDGASSGSWLVANPYDFGHDMSVASEPYEIEQGVQVTLETLNTDTREVEFTARNYHGPVSDFGQPHDQWVTEEKYDTEDNGYLYFGSNERVILDPQTDSITAARAMTALEHAATNELHAAVEEIRHDVDTAPRAVTLHEAGVKAFDEWLNAEVGPESYPSEEQSDFITEMDAQLVGLQGPPGTGKTSGAFAPGLCARAYGAAAAGANFAGLVTAPSNTAINEVLESTTEILETVCDEDDSGEVTIEASLDDVDLVRIGDGEPPAAPDNVTYIDYNDPDDDELLKMLGDWVQSEAPSDTREKGQAGLDAFGGGAADEPSTDAHQTLVFATPARAWKLVKELSGADGPEAVAETEYWDMIAADEASMLTLPEFLLAGSGLKPGGQVLVGGDHRQLPPVQTHDWEEERRRDIRAAVPYLSAIEYLRLLRGEPDVLDEERRTDWIHEHTASPEATGIRFVRLSETFRFGVGTAELVGDAVYESDGIDYTSGRDAAPGDVSPSQLDYPLSELLDEAPITLVTYDSATDYQEWNPIEAALAAEIVAAREHGTTAGVVTPHNAQRSRITSKLEEIGLETGSGESVSVDTVNRFQGGEADLMVVSATVSDPKYIARESDFLLNENRVNVSFTRHREKLVILAPESILGYIPDDPDLYDETVIWKTVAQQAGEAPTKQQQPPEWKGPLSAILDDDAFEFSDAEISVYSIRTP
jgi:hypothetical protein